MCFLTDIHIPRIENDPRKSGNSVIRNEIRLFSIWGGYSGFKPKGDTYKEEWMKEMLFFLGSIYKVISVCFRAKIYFNLFTRNKYTLPTTLCFHFTICYILYPKNCHNVSNKIWLFIKYKTKSTPSVCRAGREDIYKSLLISTSEFQPWILVDRLIYTQLLKVDIPNNRVFKYHILQLSFFECGTR